MRACVRVCVIVFVCVHARARVFVFDCAFACLQVMRHCRMLVSQLSEKLEWWGDDWELPNMYMKLLFIVSCS